MRGHAEAPVTDVQAESQGSFRRLPPRPAVTYGGVSAEGARPYHPVANRNRLLAGPDPRGDARGNPLLADRRRRLHRRPRGRLPDARRPSPRRPDELRLVRPRLGRVRAYQDDAAGQRARGPHAREPPRRVVGGRGRDGPERGHRRVPAPELPRDPRPPPEASGRPDAAAQADEGLVADPLVDLDDREHARRERDLLVAQAVG